MTRIAHDPPITRPTPGPAGPDSMPAAGIQLLRWPDEGARRRELAARRIPRVLLVPEGVRPPDLADDEDWVRVPADERDLWARMCRLAATLRRRYLPELRDGVVLRHGDASVVLAESDGRLAGRFIERFGELLLRAELEAVVWPDGAPSDRALDARVHRLRGRLAGVGLVIHTIRGRGFVLDRGDRAPGPASTSPERRTCPWPSS